MIPLDQKKYNFDISKVEFNKDGVIDFYWPLDNKKTTDLMNSISANLIPYITFGCKIKDLFQQTKIEI